MSMLSNRTARKVLTEHAKATALTERVLLAFLNLGFVGRMRWLLTGKVR